MIILANTFKRATFHRAFSPRGAGVMHIYYVGPCTLTLTSPSCLLTSTPATALPAPRFGRFDRKCPFSVINWIQWQIIVVARIAVPRRALQSVILGKDETVGQGLIAVLDLWPGRDDRQSGVMTGECLASRVQLKWLKNADWRIARLDHVGCLFLCRFPRKMKVNGYVK